MNNLMKKLVVAFDLDGTIINAKHRARRFENGEFDIDYWKRNSTVENILKNELLPLASLFYEFKKTGHTIICVTARVLSEGDYAYFKKHNLDFDLIIHRENSLELDCELKNNKLKDFFEKNNYIPYIAFDDKLDNLKVFSDFGFRVFNANYMNEKLSKDFYDPSLKPEKFL